MATTEAITEPIEQLLRRSDEKKSSDEGNHSRCSFVITGFGPFAGVPNNPTSTLISCLRNNQAQLLDDGLHIRETHILDTSADAAKCEIQGIFSRLCSRINLENGNGDTSDDCLTKDVNVIVMLHMGVKYSGTQMTLEQCAYNDATFREPDNNGYQPQKKCILGDSSTLGDCLQTTLDLNKICTELQKQGHPYCCVSQDPGRYVCNYTYCLSLNQCQSVNNTMKKSRQQCTKQLVECHSLFLHVTPFSVISEEKQFSFILNLLKSIEEDVSQKVNKVSKNNKKAS
ncbi:hypothetical protein ACHAXM_003316 [Skeletonema potamos]